MKASDIMVRDVVTVGPDQGTQDVAQILLDRRISAAPVVDADGRLLGIVSEGDLIRRVEIGTEERRSWWLDLFTSPDRRAETYIKARALKVSDVMTREVVTAEEATPIGEIAGLLERRGIKRVPILRDGKVVGIVSRANLLRAFANAPIPRADSDQELKERVLDELKAVPGGMPWLVTVTVSNGFVELWGPVDSDAHRAALRVAAEATPGVKGVQDSLYRVRRTAA